jgi:hypothetical protein
MRFEGIKGMSWRGKVPLVFAILCFVGSFLGITVYSVCTIDWETMGGERRGKCKENERDVFRWEGME